MSGGPGDGAAAGEAGSGTGGGAGREPTDGAAPTVGVMMLDTRFPRHPRDIGQARGLPFAALHGRVARASVARVVRGGPPDDALLEPFAAAGIALVARGASLLATSCGFLHPWQATLGARLPVPFVASALSLLPALEARCPGGRIGVLTFDADAFARARTAGARTDTLLVEGLAPDGHFRAVVEGDLPRDDPARLREEVADAARRLAVRGPVAVVLECTNLAPWRAEVERECAVPVVDVVDAVLAAAPPAVAPSAVAARGPGSVR